MEFSAVLLARAMVWIEPADLNPQAAVFYPDIIKALVARYKFRKVPEKSEDFDVTKGITFAGGQFEGRAIDQLVLYTYGIVLDTRISTAESQRILTEVLQWASQELGLVFNLSMARRWLYASQVTFYSSILPQKYPQPLRELSEKISREVSKIAQEDLKYEPTSILIDYDQLIRKHPLGAFSIQRRDNTPYSENKFFSAAPLPTDIHKRLLEEYEASLS
jgi:hypothetical protein